MPPRPAADTDLRPAARPARWRFVPIAVILLGLCLTYALGLQDYASLEMLAEKRDALVALVASYGMTAPIAFGLVYAIVTTFGLPIAGVLTVFGGFLFGWLVAGLVVAVSATIGATAVFLAARSAFGDGLRCRVRGRLAALSEGFEKSPFGYLLVLRLTPIFPFFVVNVAPAFFRVSTSTYVATTFLGILPGTFTLAYLGEGIDSVLTAAREAGRQPTLADLVTPEITLALTALASIAVLAMILKSLWTRRAKASSGRG